MESYTRDSTNKPQEEQNKGRPFMPICRLEPESVMHALWACFVVKDVWFVYSRRLQKMKVGFKSFKEVVEHVIATLSEEDVELFACIAYHVWRRRNIFLFEGKFENPSRLAQAALQLTKDFKEANDSKQTGVDPGRPIGTNSWSPPPMNVYKANRDALVDRVHNRMGVGVVIRNWEGLVTATLRSSRSLFPDVKLAEAMAALRAVLFCKQLGISRLLLEVDALNVVNDINKETMDWSSARLIIQDIKAEFQSLEYGSTQFISRNSNCIAHCLAKDALKLSQESLTMEGVPPCIQHLLN
ncbi:uncharacterized protein LOC121236549 [Juglans microcarpa x Juglans regia]|uniref:uncharacterized protein LOC121236549 n=1 Tax=Juglans microcarpa x Juglans regia TaxID=2249226 RepID=UPI001B7F4E66|nr:uncharacterized protein LOC121236549 [Juglans microcarpa x Juglans regia]